MRVLTWNLYHGRDSPPDPALFTTRGRLLRRTERNATHAQVNRPLLDEFGDVIDRLDWDLALLQEAPPRWFAELARRTRSNGLRVLTSRNLCPPLQGRLADLNPDLVASSEGGSNQILARAPLTTVEHHRLTLAWRPEQRRMHWARIALRENFGLGDPTAPDAIDHLLVRELSVHSRPRRLAPERRELTAAHGLRIRLSDHAPVAATFLT
jgi:hypothetical protein